MNIVEPILFQAKFQPEASALCAPGGDVISYARLVFQMSVIGRRAMSLGLGPGSVVALSIEQPLNVATPAVTVALHDGGQPLAQLVTVDAHRHAELLAPAIAKIVADAGASQRDLTGIVVGVGPGPYTGLRVGLVTARVLGSALGIPVYGLCTLDVIAAGRLAGPSGVGVAER